METKRDVMEKMDVFLWIVVKIVVKTFTSFTSLQFLRSNLAEIGG